MDNLEIDILRLQNFWLKIFKHEKCFVFIHVVVDGKLHHIRGGRRTVFKNKLEYFIINRGERVRISWNELNRPYFEIRYKILEVVLK